MSFRYGSVPSFIFTSILFVASIRQLLQYFVQKYWRTIMVIVRPTPTCTMSHGMSSAYMAERIGEGEQDNAEIGGCHIQAGLSMTYLVEPHLKISRQHSSAHEQISD